LKVVRAEHESKIVYQEERLQAATREVGIKAKQVDEYEEKLTKTQDDLDLTRYKY